MTTRFRLSTYPPDTSAELSIGRVSFPAPIQTSVLDIPGSIHPSDPAHLAFHPNSLILAIATPLTDKGKTAVSIRSIN